eukprot:gene5631-biopygen13266
MSRGGCSR